MPSPSSPIIALSGGGTGGHLFPAEAVGRALLAAGARPVLITDERAGTFSDDLDAAIPVHRLQVSSLSGGLLGRLRGIMGVVRAYRRARALLPQIGVDGVIGFGGYASYPAGQAATHLGRPLVLFEANTVLGKANRQLAAAANHIATGFPQLARNPKSAKGKPVHTGVPVRPEIQALAGQGYTPPADDGPIHVLITGGSQGAQFFGRAIPPALVALPEALKARLRLVHQVRAEDLEQARGIYAGAGIQAETAPFFHDMPQRLSWCHLCVGRAGASTVSEAALAQRPALLIPLPTSADQHQSINAMVAERVGAARHLEQKDATPDTLTATFAELLGDRARLATMAEAAPTLARPDAAQRVAKLMLDLLGAQRGPA